MPGSFTDDNQAAAVDRGARARRLLRDFMADAPFQPATNLWRAIEIPILADALPRQGRGLDVGCGDGVLTRLLARLADDSLAAGRWTLVGIDPDPAETALAEAEKFYAAVHTTGADRVPEPAASFDFAFANSVLEHIPDLPPCLTEIGRCLKPGGEFYATVPSPGLHKLMRGPSFLRRISREDYLAETDRRLLHFRYPSVDDWRAMLDAAGFDLVSARGYLTARQVCRWERWTNCTGGLLYRLKGAKARPIEIQRQFGMRRAMPKPLKLLAGPLAWAAGRGVLDDDATNPNETACLLVVGRRR
jgi:SAM-dependent methyltransferase